MAVTIQYNNNLKYLEEPQQVFEFHCTELCMRDNIEISWGEGEEVNIEYGTDHVFSSNAQTATNSFVFHCKDKFMQQNIRIKKI